MNRCTAGMFRRPCAAATATIRPANPIGSSHSRLNHLPRPTRTRGAMPLSCRIEPAHVVGRRRPRPSSVAIGRSIAPPARSLTLPSRALLRRTARPDQTSDITLRASSLRSPLRSGGGTGAEDGEAGRGLRAHAPCRIPPGHEALDDQAGVETRPQRLRGTVSPSAACPHGFRVPGRCRWYGPRSGRRCERGNLRGRACRCRSHRRMLTHPRSVDRHRRGSAIGNGLGEGPWE